ncbi:altronate dehydratase family protein [Fulvivirgaceae bacterium BMA10]|uniref:Altronate dehydratase family protein n=1 Tax=Splendidivirga corallicola TaxID=3051826 RepID=A0ABT8KRM9_9BACT|nr:altronate dehydratase family protein [Fulvivirgaceae bacterium BMA10]
MRNKKILQVHPSDNVLVALSDLKAGERIDISGSTVDLAEDISAKHKFAIHEIAKDELIFMYGTVVGRALTNIAAGQAITIENVIHHSLDFSADKKTTHWNSLDVSKWENKFFLGYHRENGSVGTMNVWLVVSLVFCENRNVELVREALENELGYGPKKEYGLNIKPLVKLYKGGADVTKILASDIASDANGVGDSRVFNNVDGVKFLTHNAGCGGTRQDAEAFCALLAGYITHPNVAGATVLSLGCQNAEEKILMEYIHKYDPGFDKPLYILEQQNSASEKEYIIDAVKKTFCGLIEANKFERKPAPLNKLVLGVECGGSDGFSGISANPALGHASDILVSLNGSVVLAEFPELNGVEQELINRCIHEKDAAKFIDLMKTYNKRAKDSGSGFEANPSPGNIKDGLITDAMKSAGAAKKGGTSPVVEVLDYTEQVTKPGLSLLCTPGNDVESTTGLAGSGANVIVFTTGLGTPTGNPIAPTIKASSNTALFQRMNDIIDFNAGTIISGEDSIESKGEELIDYIIKVASGDEIPKSVQLGQDDFIPWKRGISL